MDDLIRDAVTRQFKQRSPTTLEFMRSRALKYYIQLAQLSSSIEGRREAFMEFFHLLDKYTDTDASWAGALCEDEYILETATADNIPEIETFLASQSCADRQGASPAKLNCGHIVNLMPDAITLLRTANKQLQGLLVILPINRTTMEYLSSEAVAGEYLKQLNEPELQACNTPPYHTEHRFIRLISLTPQADITAYQALYRHLIKLLAEPARFIAVQQSGISQQFLSNLGFEKLTTGTPAEYGDDRRHLSFLIADVRHKRLRDFMEGLIKRRIEQAEDIIAATPPPHQPHSPVARDADDSSDMLGQLTRREREVAIAAVEGLANQAIANRLGVSEVTVKKHMSRIFTKLNINNRRELIKQYWSTQQGLG